MNALDHTLSKKTTVINELGLHARPAALIACLALKARADVRLCKNDEEVDASSIIDILSLSCVKGSDVTLKIDHPEDIHILDEIINLFESGFGEQP